MKIYDIIVLCNGNNHPKDYCDIEKHVRWSKQYIETQIRWFVLGSKKPIYNKQRYKDHIDDYRKMTGKIVDAKRYNNILTFSIITDNGLRWDSVSSESLVLI